jgi:hypothetical protein
MRWSGDSFIVEASIDQKDAIGADTVWGVIDLTE